MAPSTGPCFPSEGAARPVLRSALRLAVAAVCGLAAVQAAALEPAEIFEKVSPSVWEVRVIGPDGKGLSMGSAVVIGDGVVITNCHVLRGGKQVWLKRGNANFGARLQYPDVERDLCQLRVADFHYPPVTLAPGSALVTGQKVYAIGNPLGLELTISEGLISSLRTDDDGRLKSVQTSAAISRGSSGGGLFDANGRLIGITDHQVVLTLGQNLNFAIPADWIADVPARAQKALAARAAAASAVVASTPAPQSAAPTPAPAPAPRHQGELGPNQQTGFSVYLQKTWPKAFVAADGDHYYYWTGKNAELYALSACQERWQNCSVYARNNTVVEPVEGTGERPGAAR
ncbi:S1C family serine protease [Ralstonia nicotianae]|uniref:S1C family serine protease n=1 Tax=Ralstonia pseudosolanacearum TaxID=1310165 RepID=UPI001F377DD6|nr:S1C family serine protease [Ralstonia solanacearum]